MVRAAVLCLALLTTACAETSIRTVAFENPQAAFDAAKIAEGAYLASSRATPEGLAQLIALDRIASHAMWRYQQQPGATQATELQLAVAALADYLSTDARL